MAEGERVLEGLEAEGGDGGGGGVGEVECGREGGGGGLEGGGGVDLRVPELLHR